MNKIININLAGRSIPIDENAYSELNNYINWLKNFFSKEKGGEEIVRDMEDRIGELFQNKLKDGYPCIMSEDVQSMIGIMGSPEQIANEADETFTSERDNSKQNTFSTSGAQHNSSNYINKEQKLSRSLNDKMVGGVCGGIAAHFNLDPAIVRIAFALITLAWGTGFLIYVILWAVLPISNTTAIKAPRKKLYRNPDQKAIGGVCSGLAAYFKVDTIVMRLIFLLPVLLSFSFGWINLWDFDIFPAVLGSIPTTLIIIYIVILATVPEAKTVVQKLEMRGENIDVQTLSDNINSDSKKNNSTMVESEKQSRSTFGNILAILIKIIVFFFLSILLIVMVSIAIAFIAALFGVAVSGFAFFPLLHLITDSYSYSWLLWSCLLILFIIPFSAIIRLIVRIITGRKHQPNKWRGYITTTVFILSIIGILFVAGTIIKDFKINAINQQQFTIQQPINDTLIITQEGSKYDLFNNVNNKKYKLGWNFKANNQLSIPAVSITIAKSADSSFHVITENEAYGNTFTRAKTIASNFSYNIRQEGNKLILPRFITLAKGSPYRGQNLNVVIQVPQNGTFKTENLDDDIYEHNNINIGTASIQVNSYDTDQWENGIYYKIDDKPLVD